MPRSAGRRLLSCVVGFGLTGVLLVPVAAGMAGVILPAAGIFPALGRTTPSLEPWVELLAAPGLWRSVALTAASALAATAISVVLTALVLCAALGTRALAVVERLLAPVLAVPHAAVALALALLIAPSGLILRALSPWATGYAFPPDILTVRDPFALSLTLALVVKEVPFLFLIALAALPQVRPEARLAVARSLGHGRMGAALFAVWPAVYRAIRLPVLAVLAFSASVVDMALVLGPTRPPTFAVRIVDWMRTPDVSTWLVGSAAAALMLLLILALFALWRGLEVLAGRAMARLAAGGRRLHRDRVVAAVSLGVTAALIVLMTAGFAGLMVQSAAGYWPFPDLWPATFSLAAVAARLPGAAEVVATTLSVAIAATAITLVIAVALLECERLGARLSPLLYAPLLVPQVAFLFGLNVVAISAGLTPGAVAVTLAHGLFTLPYTLIALAGPWRALDPRYDVTAAALGAGPMRRFFAVRLPLLSAPLCVAAALSFATSVALYLPTQLIGGGRVTTVTTEAVAAAAGADRRAVGVWVAFQLLLPFLAFTLARAVPAVLFRHRRALRPVRHAARASI